MSGTPLGLCFSNIVLRCSSFSVLQNELLIIGPSLELLFTFSLIFTNWRSGRRRHLFLTAEGISYFSLALLDMLSHILPAVRGNFQIFKVIDIVLGAATFLPILFYTIFIYVLVRKDFCQYLPNRFHSIAKILFLVFIPAIIALSEIAAFIGVRRVVIPYGASQTPTIAIGFDNATNGQLIWTFFTSFSLALLTAYQALAFCIAFYRTVRVAINQRQIETSSSDQAHLFKGIGWIAGALKLGAIETIVGFAQPGFGTAMTRRSLRFLGRAFFCIGMAKGMDSVEDFHQLREEMGYTTNEKGFRRSRILRNIGNPRHSTFRQMSPTATAFHSAPHANRGPYESSPLARGGLDGLKGFVGEARPRQRVTVHYPGGSEAPTLEMRFSELGMPSPQIIVENVKSRPATMFSADVADIKRRTALTEAGSIYRPSPSPSPPLPHLPGESSYNDEYGRSDSYDGGYSLRAGSLVSVPDSVNTLTAVRELASQFPRLPGASDKVKSPLRDSSYSQEDGDSFISSPPPNVLSPSSRGGHSSMTSVSSAVRRQAPLPSPIAEGPEGSDLDVPIDVDSGYNETVLSDPHQSEMPTTDFGSLVRDYSESQKRTKSLNTASQSGSPTSMMSSFTRKTTETHPTTADFNDTHAFEYEMSDPKYNFQQGRRSSVIAPQSDWVGSMPMDQLATAVMDEQSARSELHKLSDQYRRQDVELRGNVDSVYSDASHEREHDTVSAQFSPEPTQPMIKTFGSAPHRRPTLASGGLTRESVHIQPISIPPPAHHSTEIIQSDESPSTTYGSSLLRNVLGDEDVLEMQRH